MPRRPPLRRRWATATRWPVGVALTSWTYMWRTTPMHRTLEEGDIGDAKPPDIPQGVDRSEIQTLDDGVGPIFHRRYGARIVGAKLSSGQLMSRLAPDLDQVAPNEFASFQKTRGEAGEIERDDEYVVRMPGPWDGPVRVVLTDEDRLRLATLDGHLEAGQIQFSARPGRVDGEIEFEIESWARSGDRLSDLLYDRLLMSREIQLHLWVSLIERVAKFAGGKLKGGIEIYTRRLTES